MRQGVALLPPLFQQPANGCMPTFEREARFDREYQALTLEQQISFRQAKDVFVAVLKEYEATGRAGAPKFPKGLGVKRMAGRVGILEFAWSGDGRCTWEYGRTVKPGCIHVIWRRIGKHEIYNAP